jgi:DNA-binding LacI/PurR family transcriptional regulator
VAGIAAIVSEMRDDVLDELGGTGIPVVCYDFTSKRGLTNIRSNYRKGMRQLVDYLYSLGHRRMALVAYRIALGPTEDRRQAFLETMAMHSAPAHVLSPVADGALGGREAVCELLASNFDASAVICINDLTALGVLKEFHERGIAVPGQVSVTGFDNIQLGQYTVPSLTTVDIHTDRVAELAFDALRASARGDTERGKEFLLDPELIVRGSTAVCAERG